MSDICDHDFPLREGRCAGCAEPLSAPVPSGYVYVQPSTGRVRKKRKKVPKFVIGRAGKWVDGGRAEAIVDMLEKAGGDLEIFAECFDKRTARQDLILTKVFFVLNKPENQEHKERWDMILACHKEARQALMQKDALEALAKMPKPKGTASPQTWIAYGKFWNELNKQSAPPMPKGLSPKEKADARAHAEAKRGVDAMQQLAEKIKAQHDERNGEI